MLDLDIDDGMTKEVWGYQYKIFGAKNLDPDTTVGQFVVGGTMLKSTTALLITIISIS